VGKNQSKQEKAKRNREYAKKFRKRTPTGDGRRRFGFNRPEQSGPASHAPHAPAPAPAGVQPAADAPVVE